jgi:hypothetical protein
MQTKLDTHKKLHPCPQRRWPRILLPFIIPDSLGVHEHWNNAIDKQYSRNLDPNEGQGIELVILHDPNAAAQLPITYLPIDIGLTEAEDLDMINYEYDEYYKDGVKNARCTSISGGNIAGTFIGKSGKYDLTIRYLDEDDGEGWIKLYIDDELLGTMQLDSEAELWLDWAFTNVNIQNGAIIRIEGIWHDSERARIDYLLITGDPCGC